MVPRRDSDRQVLTLRTLGAWGLRFGESPESESDSSPSKTLAFLAYLACSPGATARRERLVDLLWAHAEPDAGDAALRQLTWHFRTRFGEDFIRSAAGALTLAAPLECDRTSFLQAIEKQDFETAVRLYGGDFLPGFAAPGGAEFERWADVERWRLRSLFLLACDNVTRRWLAAGRFREATAVARRARDADRDSEAGWRLLLEALAASGDTMSAAVEAEELRRLLAEDRRAPEPATAAAIRRALHEQTQSAPGSGASLVTELVGRERQFTAITKAWDATRGGRGCHVHVEAAAGLGKTRLLHDASARLRAGGAAVVDTRANPGEQEVRYAFAAALAAALAELPGSNAVAPGSADALVALNPRLSSRFAAAKRAVAPGGFDARVFFLALADLVDGVSEEAPVALMIDDVHWADGESRGLLAALLERLAPRHVLLVTTARPGPEGRFERSDTQQLALEPLGVDQVRLALASAGRFPDAEWAAGLAQALHRSTLGSPLLVVETLRLALSRELLRLSEGEWGSKDPVGLYELLAQGGALHQRIVDLTRERRWLLMCLAVAGVPVHKSVLHEAVRRPDADVGADLDELNRLGFAVHSGGTWAPAHDAIAERLLDIATPEQLAAAHGALGRALAARTDDPSALRAAAHHLKSAGAADALDMVAATWIRLRRAAGDRRPASTQISELLGTQAGDAQVRRVVRRLPLGVRLRPGRVAAIAVATLVMLASAGLLAVSRNTAADPGVLIGQWRHEADGHWRLFARQLTAADVAVGHLALSSLKRTNVVSWDRGRGDLRPDHPGALLATRAYPDAGGEDLAISENGRWSRLTSTAGDDYNGTWSPDGRLLAFSTDRWTPLSQSAVAVMDPDRPGAVKRLTRGGVTRDVASLWSPDGSRIAFVRTHILTPQPSEMCAVTVDGAREWCPRAGGHELIGPAGWANPRELLAWSEDSSGVRRILTLDLETGASREIAQGEIGGASHATGWFVCFCRRTRDEPMQLLVIPVANPERAVRLDSAVSPAEVELFGATRPTERLERLKIGNAPPWIPADGSWRLELLAWDAAGEPREPLAVRWWTSDPTTAAVDSAGEVHPLHRGSVTVYATSGGWRTDSVKVGIRDASTTLLLNEDWRGVLRDRWVPFGTPRPFVARTASGPALATNGDSTFSSGVFTRRLLPVRGGLGIEFTASTPLTMSQWQTLEVSVLSADSLTTRGWDLVKGQVVTPDQQWRSCGVIYPREGHSDQVSLVSGSTWTGRVPPTVARGEWTRVRIQVFPDGRCGLAINGQPRAILNQPIGLGDSALIMFGGFSYHTRILVGAVEVWRGVRRDIDWSKAENPHP